MKAVQQLEHIQRCKFLYIYVHVHIVMGWWHRPAARDFIRIGRLCRITCHIYMYMYIRVCILQYRKGQSGNEPTEKRCK